MKTITELIHECGLTLKRECLRRTGHYHLLRSDADKLVLPGPPLQPGGRIGSVNLNELVRALYDNDEVTYEQVFKVWTEAVHQLTHRKLVRSEFINAFREVFPSAKFAVAYQGDIRAVMVQFLVMTSWHFGRLSLTKDSAALHVEGGRFGVNRRSIEWPGDGYRVLQNEIDFNVHSCLSQGVGKLRNVPKDLAALHRFLTSSIPEKVTEIEIFLSAVTYMGRGAGDAIVDMFDIEYLHDFETSDMELWDSALKVIQSSIEDPRGKLNQILVPTVMDQREFRQLFRRPGPAGFDTKARKRYRLGLLQAQSSRVKAPSDTADAQKLLDLQRLLGGSA